MCETIICGYILCVVCFMDYMCTILLYTISKCHDKNLAFLRHFSFFVANAAARKSADKPAKQVGKSAD
jgi:hypothetical protein